MHKILSLLLLALAMASAKPGTPRGDITSLIEDCGSRGTIGKVTMEGCDGDSDDECEVFQGGVAKGQLEFTSDVAASTLKCQLHGIIGGSELPFPSGCTNGCDALSQGQCPVAPGDTFVYDLELKIENFFPALSVIGKWELLDENDEAVLCFLVPIKISS